MNWQFYLPDQAPAVSGTGDLLVIARLGRKTHDSVNAARLYLLSAMVVWAVAKLLLFNEPAWRGPVEQIRALGRSIADSKLLDRRGRWDEQLMGHLFFKPEYDRSDAPL